MHGAINSEPIVSIIVPTYNRAYCLGRTIQSVLDQTYGNWELIIIDNHSSDGTDNLISKFCDPRICVIKINNAGIIAASRNRGIDAAKGKYVAFLDSDDWWCNDKLSVSVNALESGADFVFHDLYEVTLNSLRVQFWKRLRTREVRSPVYKDLLQHGNCICNSSVVVRRTLLEIIGGLSECLDLVSAEDFDAWIRISKHTNAFVRLNRVHGYYWSGGGSESSYKRMVVSFGRLKTLYAHEMAVNGNYSSPYWMYYSLARSCYIERDFKSSIQFARQSIQNNTPLGVMLKSLLTIVLCILRYSFVMNLLGREKRIR